MKTNLAITAAQVAIARGPLIGEEVEVYFAPENCVDLGSLRALTATTAEYTSSGGLGIPTGGRDVIVRASSANLTGVGGAMSVTFNVMLFGDIADTAVATFHIPTWAASQANKFPIGLCADLVPTTLANAALKVLSVGTLVSVANMTPGNKFDLLTTPDSASFTFIECCRNKGGAHNLPGVVEIPCGRNPAAFTKLGRGESKQLEIAFASRGALEQLNRFTGHQGTIRFDLVKDDSVLTERKFYSGFWVLPDGGAIPDVGEVENSATGPYTTFAFGYARISA